MFVLVVQLVVNCYYIVAVTFVPKTSCKQFQCISSTVCVSFTKTCDGNADCPDASDESQLYANCAISKFLV